jgi:isopentenyldiphosphate isomerase
MRSRTADLRTLIDATPQLGVSRPTREKVAFEKAWDDEVSGYPVFAFIRTAKRVRSELGLGRVQS